MNRRARTRLHNLAYYLLLTVLLGILGWLSQHHRLVLDWCEDRRNSLDPTSLQVLSRLSEPLEIEVFIGPAEAPRAAIRELVARYRQHKPDLVLSLVDPRTQPARVRELDAVSSETLSSLDDPLGGECECDGWPAGASFGWVSSRGMASAARPAMRITISASSPRACTAAV